MGVSRSASTVIAYAMKQQHWTLDVALTYVRDRRSIIKPNEGFMKQLQTYSGILSARLGLVLFFSVLCSLGAQLRNVLRVHLSFQPAAP